MSANSRAIMEIQEPMAQFNASVIARDMQNIRSRRRARREKVEEKGSKDR